MNALYSQVTEMVRLQNEMNTIVNPNWAYARYPFLRAAMVEAVEAIEHHGFKWWKKQQPDMKQVQMEIVDIVHFLISDYVVRHTNKASWDTVQEDILAEVVDEIIDDIQNTSTNFGKVVDQLQDIVALSASRVNPFPEVISLLPMIDMDFDKLYKMYVGKNALNTFRQANGYRDGSYIKDWNGREDNEHLYEILTEESLTPGEAFGIIYKALEQRYTSL